MSNTYDINIKNPDGGDFTACLSLPVSGVPAPAIIVIQEIFGLNHDVRSKCNEWAAKGYVAIAPDLFWRQEPHIQLTDKTPEEWEIALKLLKGFDLNKGIFDLNLTLQFIRTHPACNRRVGAVGYCLGGKLAYLMATRTDVDASVGYYGVDLGRFMPEEVHIKNPLVLHIAEEDKFVTKDEQAQIKAALEPNPHVTVYSYAGVDHAFSRKEGTHYDAAAATLANTRTAEFFAQQLPIGEAD